MIIILEMFRMRADADAGSRGEDRNILTGLLRAGGLHKKPAEQWLM